MDLGEIKKADLREYARAKYGIECNSKGMAHCPFHPPDKTPSLSFYQWKGGSWRYKCFHEDSKTGTIIDFVMALEGKDRKEACSQLLKEFGGSIEKVDPKILAPAAETKPGPAVKKERKVRDRKKAVHKPFFDYKDPDGKLLYRKSKYVYEDGYKEFFFKHHPPGKPDLWDETSKGPAEWVPYNLDKFKGNTEVIICEGEKDANTITRLKAGHLATSAPTGKGSWPDPITPHFKAFKKMFFLYDVGAEKNVQGHAQKLQKAYPKAEIFIVKVPMKKEGADITDYLLTIKDLKQKQAALSGLLNKSEKFMADKIEGDRPHAIQADLEKIILARLIQQPEYLTLEGLEASLFSAGPSRRIFRAIKKLIKDGEKIDEILVSKEAGIKVNEALEVVGGIDRIPAENFKRHIQKLREATHHKDLFNEIEKQKEAFVKGAPPDFSALGKILDKIEGDKPDKKRPQAETLTEFLKRDLPKRQVLIEPILGLEEMTMIHGRPKIGKSLLSLQIARSLITGEAWLGFTTHKIDRPILIIQVELSMSLMQERAQNFFGDIADLKVIDSNMMILDKVIIPFQSRNIFLDDPAGQDQVLCFIEDFNPALVILDPYSKFFSDEEMALKNPRPFFDFWQEQIEAHRLSLLFIHHDAKFQEGKLGGQKALGTTSINASTDGNWNVERILDAGLDPVEFLRTARLSFESRNWENIRPLDIRIGDNLAFETIDLPRGSVNEWDLVEEIEKAGGQIDLKALLPKFKSKEMFYKAKNRALSDGLIDEIKLETRGNPVMLLLKGGDTRNKTE